MLAGPFALGVVGKGDVVGRGQFPRMALAQSERQVLGVIVAVARHHVEHHAPEGLFLLPIRQL